MFSGVIPSIEVSNVGVIGNDTEIAGLQVENIDQENRITELESYIGDRIYYKEDGNLNLDMLKDRQIECYWMIDNASTINLNVDCLDINSRIQLHIRFKDMASPLYQKTINVNIGQFQAIGAGNVPQFYTPAYVVYDKDTKTTATSSTYSKTNLSNDRSWHIDIYYNIYFGTPRLIITVNNIVR